MFPLVNRKGRKKRWDMLGGSTTWVDPATARNLARIYSFLKERTRVALREGSRVPMFTYSQIARETKMDPKQVQLACSKMAYRREPHFRLHAIVYPYGRGGAVRTVEKVEFLGAA